MTEKERKKEERIQIPRVTYEGKDEVLKEQVVHYEKGTRRIVLFTVVGLLLGWFSYCYYGEEFLPLKIILAIPYKCSELLHQSLHGDHGLYLRSWIFAGDAFFPQAHVPAPGLGRRGLSRRKQPCGFHTCALSSVFFFPCPSSGAHLLFFPLGIVNFLVRLAAS